jgi:ABC-type nitrate/sulfonate/bicarbonate transport system substrate-binding protein
METAVRLALKAHGMDPSSVIYTPVGYGPARRASVASGALPAAVIALGDVRSLKETGALAKGHLLSDIYNEVAMGYGGIAANDALLQDDAGLVKRFLKATLMGMAYARQFEKETIDIVASYNEGADRTALTTDYDGVVAGMTEHGALPREIQEQDAAVRAELIGVSPEAVGAVETMFDYTLVTTAWNELRESGWEPER